MFYYHFPRYKLYFWLGKKILCTSFYRHKFITLKWHLLSSYPSFFSECLTTFILLFDPLHLTSNLISWCYLGVTWSTVVSSTNVVTSITMYSSDIGVAGTGRGTNKFFYRYPGKSTTRKLWHNIVLRCAVCKWWSAFFF